MTLLDRSGGSPVEAPDATSSASSTADANAVERKGWPEQVALFLFITLPFLALLVAVPVAWGGWLGWHDVVIAVLFYVVAGHGITVGFHRYFTHGSFKARRWLRVTLALAGSMAIEGPVIRWVAWSEGCGGPMPAGSSTASSPLATSTPPT